MTAYRKTRFPVEKFSHSLESSKSNQELHNIQLLSFSQIIKFMLLLIKLLRSIEVGDNNL